MSQSIRGAVAERQGGAQKPRNIVEYIQTATPELQRALPKGMDGDRVARLALTVVRNNPDLAECDIRSFAGALMTAAALGLEPGVNGEAYLVPYKRECTLIIGYQGYAKLFWQHPLARHLECRAVYENDEFDYAYGLEPYLVHKPARNHEGQRITDYYAVATLSTGASAFTVLSPEEVKLIRGGKEGPNGKIADPMHWMERKTALRQLVKTLPKSTNMQYALDLDEKNGSELASRRIPEAIEAHASDQIVEGEFGDPTESQEAAAAEHQPQAAPESDTAAADGKPATQAQLTKLNIAFTDVGWNDRADKIRALSTIVGREITSSKDLTRGEASKAMDLLETTKKSDDPQAALADTIEAMRESRQGAEPA